MSDKLGSDFNAARPQDGDWAQHETNSQGSTMLRDLRLRLKNFFGVRFDLDTGDLLDDVIRSAALKATTTPIAGTYRRVKANKKGLVIRGWETSDQNYSRIFRAVFFGNTALTSYMELDGSPALAEISLRENKIWSGSEVSRWFNPIEIPTGVTRLNFICIGAGAGGNETDAGGGGCHVEGTLIVQPPEVQDQGNIVHVYAGLPGVGGAGATPGGRSRIVVGDPNASSPKYIDALGGTVAGTGSASAVSADVSHLGIYDEFIGRSYFNNLAAGGAVGEDGKPGLVILEWYA